MRRWRSVGLILACSLGAPQHAAAQDPAVPATHELTLVEALDLARQQSPALGAAEARIDEARGRGVGASVELRDNPVLDLSGGPRLAAGETSPDIEVGLE